jgi:hypothetical protein
MLDQLLPLDALASDVKIDAYGGPTGNAYKFFGVPGPFAFNLPVAATGAQSIFQETADVWEDRRNCMNRGLIAAGQGWGSGADLALKARPILVPDCGVGIWTKLIGSTTRRNAFGDLTQLNPLFGGLGFDTTIVSARRASSPAWTSAGPSCSRGSTPSCSA